MKLAKRPEARTLTTHMYENRVCSLCHRDVNWVTGVKLSDKPDDCMQYLTEVLAETDNHAHRQIAEVGAKCSSTEAELKESGYVDGHGHTEETFVEVIMDSESSAGL